MKRHQRIGALSLLAAAGSLGLFTGVAGAHPPGATLRGTVHAVHVQHLVGRSRVKGTRSASGYRTGATRDASSRVSSTFALHGYYRTYAGRSNHTGAVMRYANLRMHDAAGSAATTRYTTRAGCPRH